MEFIKIGDEFLVTANVTSFKFFQEEGVVRAYTNDGKSSDFRGADAVLLLEYLNHPDRTHHLSPSGKTSEFQAYRERGGTALFKEWRRKLDHHRQLLDVENPGANLQAVIQGYEEFLLY